MAVRLYLHELWSPIAGDMKSAYEVLLSLPGDSGKLFVEFPVRLDPNSREAYLEFSGSIADPTWIVPKPVVDFFGQNKHPLNDDRPLWQLTQRVVVTETFECHNLRRQGKYSDGAAVLTLNRNNGVYEAVILARSLDDAKRIYYNVRNGVTRPDREYDWDGPQAGDDPVPKLKAETF